MKVLFAFPALWISTSLAANFKNAYNACLESPPHNIWLEVNDYTKNGLPIEKIQYLLDEHANGLDRLQKAFKVVKSTEVELEHLEHQLEQAIGYGDEKAIEENFGYVEDEHDKIEELIKTLQRTLAQSRQRLALAQNGIKGLWGEINRYTCFVSALSGLRLKDFPPFAPEEDGLIIGWPYNMVIEEPDFEFEAELREANYYLETALLDLVPDNAHGFVNSATNYMLVCKIAGQADTGVPFHGTVVNHEDWLEVDYEGIDLNMHTMSYSKKGWRILSERGKRQLRRIIRHQFMTAHQFGVYRITIDMSYFAVNLIDPTTVIELYKLYSYLFAQVGFRSIHFCLPPTSILRRYLNHMQKYFERLTYRNDLYESLKIQQFAKQQQVPVWKVQIDEEDDVILEDTTEDDDDNDDDDDRIIEDPEKQNNDS